MDGMGEVIRYPWEAAPEFGEAVEVAEGVLWLRLPLPMKLDHVNVYALDDGDGWTVVDTGFSSKKSKAVWEALLGGPLKGKPVTRVIVTHHHPDHVGLAGWFQSAMGAELVTTRTAWLLARMLLLDVEPVPRAETVAYWKGCGMAREVLEKRLTERPFNFADCVAPMPVGYTRIQQGDVLTAGGRTWDVHIGNGHAPEHATLWSRECDLVIAGDQILPSISSNLGVYPTEPEADPVGEWLEACERLSGLARGEHLVLGGHKLPFTGLPARMRQLIENHHSALDRLEVVLKEPKTAVDCFATLFKRRIGEAEYGLAMVEAMAHCLHLWHAGRATRERRDDGAWVFAKV